MTGREALVYLSMKYEGDWAKMTAAIKAHEPLPFGAQATPFEMPKCGVLTILDNEYPEEFKQATNPAIVLYYYGDISLLKAKTKVGYIGSRAASEYGLRMASQLGADIAKRGYVLVSGLARGIDTAALTAALDAGGRVIAVLGSGIDFYYPPENASLCERTKKEGLVISEYPLMTPPTPGKFPMRNRLIAALPKALVVGEAASKSGTMITVAYALSAGREIGCVPYRADEDSACNMLIKEGAAMVTSIDDIDDMVGNTVKKEGGD